MNILEFYKENESKYGTLSELNKENAKIILKDAKAGALAQLKTLGGNDEKQMFGILQSLLLIPISIGFHKSEATYFRKMGKKIDDKKRKLNKKIGSKVRERYDRLPVNDLEAFKGETHKSLMADKRLKLDAEDLNKLIEEFENEKKELNWQGKTNRFVKNIIYRTFQLSKGHSGLPDKEIHKYIAILLNCLKIKNTKGGMYSAKLIKPHCKTPSR